jgi:hypothetical protein
MGPKRSLWAPPSFTTGKNHDYARKFNC